MSEQSQSSRAKIILATSAVVLLAVTVIGLAWFFTTTLDVNNAATGLEQSGATIGFGWFIFSFAAGLTMIILPCTLPLAFVIVPLTMSKGPKKGLSIALCFGLGIAITLSLYGVAAAAIGKVAIGTLGAPLETVKNWLYFGAGTFAYLFALGELGLISFRMPSYTGSAPAFIQKQQDYLKALLLGLFLGNVGVGCPHPATPFILGRIAVSGSITSGWLLFFVHAVGRVIPLLLLAMLALLGVNGLTWLVARKEKIERATGWGMVFVAGFILILGLFSHDWWVFSGQHTLLEDLTREEYFLGRIISNFHLAGVPHTHGIPTGMGLFALPLWLGNWALGALWTLPFAWYYFKKKHAARVMPESEEKRIEVRILPWRRWLGITLAALIFLMVVWVLPDRFLNHSEHAHVDDVHATGGHVDGATPADNHAHAASAYYEAKDIKEGLSVDLTASPFPVSAGTSTQLDFFVNQKPGNTPVPLSQLELEHTKYMHVIGIRDDMNEFFHIHPVPIFTNDELNSLLNKTDSDLDKASIKVRTDLQKLGIKEDIPKNFFRLDLSKDASLKNSILAELETTHVFANPGRYKIWSEVTQNGVTHVVGQEPIEVSGAGDAGHGVEPVFMNTATSGGYQVEFLHDPLIVQKQDAHIGFTIRDAGGKEVPLEQYLGASMYLNIIKSDWKQEIHAHPEEGGHMTNNSAPPAFIAVAHAQHAHDDTLPDHHEDIPLGGSSGAVAQAQVHFTITFPEHGLYKAFPQFRPAGSALPPDEAVVASFWINVEEKTTPANPRAALAVASFILIAVLCWGVKKYLEKTNTTQSS